MHAMGETGASTVPAFLTKLWTLVDDSSTDELICWDVCGKSFHVFDQGRFAKEVLPLYFKHNNIASFIRQLNMYGFRKVVGVESGGLKTEREDMEFAHQYFVRDQEGLLEFIKRKVPPVKADEMKIKHDDVNRVLNDVRTLKGKQDHMSSKLETVKRENELLWREVASLRQKHMKQQQIVNKLIQFLISLVQNRGMDRKRKMQLMINDASQLEQQAKVPKFSTQLSIGPGESMPQYQVLSPQEEGELQGDGDVMQTLSIHDITDQSPFGLATVEPSDDRAEVTTAPAPTTVTATLSSPSQGLASVDSRTAMDAQLMLEALVTKNDDNTISTSETESSGLEAELLSPSQFDVSELLVPVTAQAPSQEISEEPLSPSGRRPGVTDAVLSKAALYPTTDTSVVPSMGLVQNPKKLQREMSDHIDTLQSDLNSLKELLSGGNYNVEPTAAMELYDMFKPWNPAEMPSTSSTDFSGTEVVSYNPQDIGTLFDFGDLTSLYNKDDDDEIRPITPDNTPLNTPLGTELTSPLGPLATLATTETAPVESEEVD